MGKEIIQLVDLIANERAVDNTIIFEVLEEALQLSSRNKLNSNTADIEVNIDRITGDYITYRHWEVVADNYPEDEIIDEETEEAVEFDADRQIKLQDAKAKKANIAVGDKITNQIDNPEFGRINIQSAKNLISKKIYEAERGSIYKKYQNRVGELVSGIVKRTVKEGCLLELRDKAEAILPRSQIIGRENLTRGNRIKAVITDVLPADRGAQIRVSRTEPTFLMRLLELEIPEVSDQIIKINSLARDPGFRSKIAVSTNDNRIDAVGSCVGIRGARIQAVTDELNGERIDVVQWNADPAELVLNLLKPAKIAFISVDEVLHSMDVAVEEENLAMAIGRNGQNVRLTMQMTGWKVNILSVEDAKNKQTESKQKWIDTFKEQLEVDDSVAEILFHEGFMTIDEIANSEISELASIDGFDENLAEELKNRANFQLMMMVGSGEVVVPEEDLLQLPSMTEEFANKLALVGISSKQDLADQSVYDVQDAFKEKFNEEVNEKLTSDLILEARDISD